METHEKQKMHSDNMQNDLRHCCVIHTPLDETRQADQFNCIGFIYICSLSK